MSRNARTARTTRSRRVATAVALVLAVTAGGASVAPAVAAPAATGPSATADLPQEQAVRVPERGTLRGGGASGFLTVHEQAPDRFTWTRYADGGTVELPAGTYRGSVGSDIVVKQNGPTSYELRDMATGAAPVAVDTSSLGPASDLLRAAGKTLLLAVEEASGGTSLHLVSVDGGGKLVDHEVAGLPADADFVSYNQSVPGVFALGYTHTVDGTLRKRLAVVDLATGTIADDRAVPASAWSVSASATHVAWYEKDAQGRLTVVSARRGEAATVRTPVTGTAPGLQIGLTGDWVTYTLTGGAAATEPNPLYAMMARPLAGGAPVKVMDSTKVAHYGSDTVQGGTLAGGEGVYRIAPGADGRPVATLRASSGVGTALELTGQQIPATLSFRTDAPQPVMTWYMNRGNALVHAELTHQASGRRWTSAVDYAQGSPTSRYVTSWDGAFDDYSAARNGAYTWKLIAKPRNGIGPDLVRTGSFTVDSGTAPHDYSDSGAPDLLVRNDEGRLLSYDFRQILSQFTDLSERTDHGGGWNTYDRVVSTGDVAGSRFADVVGRDRSGVLWFYQGTGTSLARRVQVGGGWQTYDKLTAGSDLTGDGRADLVATDKSGVLWLYRSTGSATKPFAPRVRIGGGWQTYDRITATGNIAGARGGDLVARDKGGVLWLYLGKGDGTFTARTRIGGGWQEYDEIVGIGDADRDGRADLLVNGKVMYRGWSLSYYKGTGDARAPFAPRRKLGTPDTFNDENGLVF
ncbi:VCBS repeat-containing protein [Streptomyces sp. NPDC051771]|uniref:FG-GAP repeat domain-containing protein n=1 Tax=Streptomyces sp. NPDC051771 TaxID=3154847 RepID=UPI00342623A8